MSHTVIGIFNSADEANDAVQQLLQNGYNNNEVDYSGSATNYSGTDTHDDNESGISRFFKNLFGDNDESKRYSNAARNRYLVTVHASSEDEARRASNLLDEFGAIDVDTDEDDSNYTGSETSSYTGDETGSYRNTASDYRFDDDNENKKIPVIEEELNVGKRVVQTGGVRVRSRIVEKPVEETIRLREERVNIERNKVNRPADDDDFENLEDTIEVKEHAEVPVVNKEARVVEEVGINKSVNEREETIRDNVRRQDVEVEDLDDLSGNNRNSDIEVENRSVRNNDL
jgi:stress response protein YsnF